MEGKDIFVVLIIPYNSRGRIAGRPVDGLKVGRRGVFLQNWCSVIVTLRVEFSKYLVSAVQEIDSEGGLGGMITRTTANLPAVGTGQSKKGKVFAPDTRSAKPQTPASLLKVSNKSVGDDAMVPRVKFPHPVSDQGMIFAVESRQTASAMVGSIYEGTRWKGR